MNTLHGERDFADVMNLRIVGQIILAYADEANLITKVLIWERGSESKKEMDQWKQVSEKER